MPDDSPQSQWRIFLRNALQTRLDIPAFTSFLPLLLQRAPLSSSAICAIFLAPPAQSTPDSIDPRVLRYLPVLLTEGLVGAGAILTALRRVSSLGNGDEGIANDDATEADGTQKVTKDAETELRWRDSCIAEESIFYRIAKHVSSGLAPVDVREADHILTVAMAWMEAVTRGLSQAAGNELLTMAGAATVRSATRMRKVDEASAVAMALGTLVISLVENPVVLRFLHGKKLASTGWCCSRALYNLG